LLLALLVTLVARVALLGLIGAGWLPIGPNHRDFLASTDGYIVLARNLVETQRFAFSPDSKPTVFRQPAFPVGIALLYALVGSYEWATLLLNVVCALAITALTYGIALHFYSGPRSFWLAVGTSLHPMLFYYGASSFSDLFLSATVTLYTWATLRALRVGSGPAAVGSGIALALSLLTKTILLLVPAAVFVVGIVWRKPPWRRLALLQVAAAGMVLLPWVARNYTVAHRLTIGGGGSGFNLLVGNFMIDHNGGADASFKAAVADALAHVREAKGRTVTRAQLQPADFYDIPADLDALFLEAALSQIRADPWRAARKVLINSLRFWGLASTPRRSLLVALVNWPVVLLGAWELLRLRRSYPDGVAAIGLIVFYIWLLYASIFTNSRFHLPAVAVLFPFALARLCAVLGPVSIDGASAGEPPSQFTTSPTEAVSRAITTAFARRF
jgi:4-amino-4-deoxy-L-arabinose transferase-like glycosyltransferase